MNRKTILDMKKARVKQTLVYDTTAEGIDITRKKDGELDEHMSNLRIVIRDCKCENGCEKCNGLKKIVTDLDDEPEKFQNIIARSKRKMERRGNRRGNRKRKG